MTEQPERDALPTFGYVDQFGVFYSGKPASIAMDAVVRLSDARAEISRLKAELEAAKIAAPAPAGDAVALAAQIKDQIDEWALVYDNPSQYADDLNVRLRAKFHSGIDRLAALAQPAQQQEGGK